MTALIIGSEGNIGSMIEPAQSYMLSGNIFLSEQTDQSLPGDIASVSEQSSVVDTVSPNDGVDTYRKGR